MYEVSFIVLESNTEITKTFYSEYLAKKFVNKLKHSKKCKLISYPYFKW